MGHGEIGHHRVARGGEAERTLKFALDDAEAAIGARHDLAEGREERPDGEDMRIEEEIVPPNDLRERRVTWQCHGHRSGGNDRGLLLGGGRRGCRGSERMRRARCGLCEPLEHPPAVREKLDVNALLRSKKLGVNGRQADVVCEESVPLGRAVRRDGRARRRDLGLV